MGKFRISSNFLQGIIFLTAGLFMVFSYFIWNYHQARVLSFSKHEIIEEPASKLIEYKKPISIKIDKIKMNLEVEEGSITDGVWQISKDKATHLNISANPGSGGNIVIYGHNKNSIFGPIRWLKLNDKIEILNEDGISYSYQITQVVEITPDKIEYVMPKDSETLTLYTCSGLLDSKRFIIIAKPS